MRRSHKYIQLSLFLYIPNKTNDNDTLRRNLKKYLKAHKFSYIESVDSCKEMFVIDFIQSDMCL